MKDEIECFSDENNRLLIMELILHCADISNPLKEFELSLVWADMVIEEFCKQGDREKAMGLEVSPMCDRDAVNVCNMQMGFIEFVVAPLIIGFINILPPMHEWGTRLKENFDLWGEKKREEINSQRAVIVYDRAEELRKLDERLAKFREKMAFVQGLKALPVRTPCSLQTISVDDNSSSNLSLLALQGNMNGNRTLSRRQQALLLLDSNEDSDTSGVVININETSMISMSDSGA